MPGAPQNLFIWRKAVSPDHERYHARRVVARKNGKRGPSVRSRTGIARVDKRREWYDALVIFRGRGGAQGHVALRAVGIASSVCTEKIFEPRFEIFWPRFRITLL